jgi:hypothetical protein
MCRRHPTTIVVTQSTHPTEHAGIIPDELRDSSHTTAAFTMLACANQFSDQDIIIVITEKSLWSTEYCEFRRAELHPQVCAINSAALAWQDDSGLACCPPPHAPPPGPCHSSALGFL